MIFLIIYDVRRKLHGNRHIMDEFERTKRASEPPYSDYIGPYSL